MISVEQHKSDPATSKVSPHAGTASNELRILILAPTGNDARLTARFLTEAGLATKICNDVACLCADVPEGCGAILLAEEALEAASISVLVEVLSQQPKWSDIPVTIITSGGEATQTQLRRLSIFGPTGNVTMLERPFRPATLVSTLEVALRSRQRQYEVRKLVRTMGNLMREKEAQAQLFDTTLSSITDLAYTFDLEGNWTYANKPLLRLWGKSLKEITGKSSLQLGYPAALAERLKQQVNEVVKTGKPVKGETYFTDAAGVEDYHEYIFSPVFGADGTVTAVCGTSRLTTDRKRAEIVKENQRRVLQLMAEDAPLSEVLDALVRTAELECAHRAFAAILLVDPDGIHLRCGAAPNLPSALRKEIEVVKIGPAGASSGTSVFFKAPIYANDIATDLRWEQHRKVALANGLRACWAFPILSSRGDVLGTFALCHSEPREAGEKDLQIAESAARTASIAIERKLSDDAIRENQKRYSQLVQGLPNAVYTTDSEGRVNLYNQAAVKLWGREPELGKDSWCGACRVFRTDGTPFPLEESPMALTLKEGRPVRGEEVIIERPDGTRRYVRPYLDPIRDASGRIVGAVNMLLDTTDSRQAEDALRRLAAIVESSDDAIISKDLNSIILSWNRGAEMLFGYKAEEVIGKPITILMPPERFDEEPGILSRIRRGESIEHYETVRVRKDGTKIEISLTVSPLKNSDGKIIGASKIARNITEKKEAERELARAHAETVAASRAKDDFLAALSHELRTPLNPVLLLASEAAEDGQLAPEIRNQFATIRNNVELEARLIDDLLDMTRITHGKLSMDMDVVNVHTLLKEAIATVQADLAQKHIELTTQLEANPSTVKGDPVRLQQVFWNVLKNAAKFTPEAGKIKVMTRTRAGELIIAITDTGVGLLKEDQKRIFEAFTQGEHGASGSHRFGGLGLGLAISNKLMELHNGSIEASSDGKNLGSTFTITIPITVESPREKSSTNGNGFQRAPLTSGHAHPLRVLLVEDHEPTRTALAHLLKRRHCEVELAGNMAQAREIFRKRDFRLLISDIGLPDGNGMDLMKELLAINKDLRGIALTGYGMEQDIAKTREAGFEVHLTKPIRMQSLDAALSTVVK